MVRRMHFGLRAFLDELPVTLAVIDMALGGALLFGGSGRTSGPGFTAAKTVASIHTWGLVLMVLAAGGLYHLWRRHQAGTWFVVCAAWLGFFAATFIRSAILSQQAALTGIVLLLGSVVLHLQAARKAG